MRRGSTKFRTVLLVGAASSSVLAMPATAQQVPPTNEQSRPAADGQRDAVDRQQDPTSPATASGNSDAAVESNDIVVTAQRTEQRLDKVPLSVSAFSQRQMDAQAVRQIDDIARLTPGLNFQRVGGGLGNNTQINIRGISSTYGASTTGLYINDTPIAVRTVGNLATNVYPHVFDLERVEVLRGPQGTLFGAGSQGGTVRFITPGPSLTTFSQYGRQEVSLTQGGAASYEAGSAIGGPIIADRLGFRVSGWYRHDGGWVDRIADGGSAGRDRNANSQDTYVIRGALTWQPVDGLRITPAVYFQNGKADDVTQFWEDRSDPGDRKFINGNTRPTPSRDRFVLPSLSVEYDFGPVALNSETSYFDRRNHTVYDYSSYIGAVFAGTPYPARGVPGFFSAADAVNKQKNFNQEVRLSSTNNGAPIHWVFGVFYTHQKQTASQFDYDPLFPQLIQFYRNRTLPPAALAAYPYDAIFQNSAVDEQIAGFGQIDVKPFDKLTLTAGLRVSHATYRAVNSQSGMAVGAPVQFSSSTSETPVTPKFGVSYQATPATLFYASAAKGFRIGGTNTPVNTTSCAADLAALGISQVPDTYKSDTVWSYEAGVKTRTPNGRFQIAASVFRIDWNDIQRGLSLLSCGVGYFANAGKARSQGFDLTAEVRPVTGLSIGLALGYTDAKYTTPLLATSGALIVADGDAVGAPYANPKWQYTLSGEYDFRAADHDLYIRGDWQYFSKGARSSNLNPEAVLTYDPSLYALPHQNIVNLRVGVRAGGVDLSAFVTNVFDTSPIIGRYHATKASPLFLDATVRPRTIGITATQRF